MLRISTIFAFFFLLTCHRSPAKARAEATNCYHQEVPEGVELICNGIPLLIKHGKDGEPGRAGSPGRSCTIENRTIKCSGDEITIPDSGSCSVSQDETGAKIACADGSEAIIRNGTDGGGRTVESIKVCKGLFDSFELIYKILDYSDGFREVSAKGSIPMGSIVVFVGNTIGFQSEDAEFSSAPVDLQYFSFRLDRNNQALAYNRSAGRGVLLPCSSF